MSKTLPNTSLTILDDTHYSAIFMQQKRQREADRVRTYTKEAMSGKGEGEEAHVSKNRDQIQCPGGGDSWC